MRHRDLMRICAVTANIPTTARESRGFNLAEIVAEVAARVRIEASGAESRHE